MPRPRIRASNRIIGWKPSCGCCLQRSQRAVSIGSIGSAIRRRRTISRRRAAGVLGGSGIPSGVRNPSSRSAALRRVGVKPEAQARQGRLDPVAEAWTRADQAFALAARAFGILLAQTGDGGHAAVIAFTPQPAEKGALQQLGVEPVGLCPAGARVGPAPPPGARRGGGQRQAGLSHDEGARAAARAPPRHGRGPSISSGGGTMAASLPFRRASTAIRALSPTTSGSSATSSAQ